MYICVCICVCLFVYACLCVCVRVCVCVFSVLATLFNLKFEEQVLGKILFLNGTDNYQLNIKFDKIITVIY